METRDKTLGLVVDFGKFANKYSNRKKEIIYEILKFGKIIPVKHWNHKTQTLTKDTLAFYLNNMVVNVNKEKCPYGDKDNWVYEIKSIFENYKKLEDEVFLEKEPVFQNGIHIGQRKLGRLISMKEIMQTIKYGLFVSDHKKQGKYWHYNRYYLLNDCCVCAKETKTQYIISTVYRTSAISDGGFLEDIEYYMQGLKTHKKDNIEFGIRDETAFSKYKKTVECLNLVMLKTIQSYEKLADAAKGMGNLPGGFSGLNDRIRYINLLALYEENPERWSVAINDEAIMKMVECGCIPYSTNPGSVPFDNFQAEPHHEYSIIINIESEKDLLTSRQKRYLKIIGTDPDRFIHNRSFTDNSIRFEFNMNQWSAADQPWSHRRNNGS